MFLNITNTTRKEFNKYLLTSALIYVISNIVVVVVSLLFTKNPLDIYALPKNTLLFVLLFPFCVSLFVFVFLLKKIHKQSLKSIITAKKKINFKKIGFSFFITAILLLVVTVVQYFLFPNVFEWQFSLKPFLIMTCIALVFIPFQSGFEELIFRGYLMQGLAKLFRNRWAPFITTSIIFGGLHFFNPELQKLGNIHIITYILAGFSFGLMTLMDDSIELALGSHIANNLIFCLLLSAEWTVFQTHSVLKYVGIPSFATEFIGVLVLDGILILIFAKKYKWTNWREKLFGKLSN